jgi:two-component system response regulator HupR/HoxA
LSPRVVRDAADEPAGDPVPPADLEGGLKERVEQLEAKVIKETLIRLRWNKSHAAEELGLSRVGLRAKLARYGLERRE